MKEKYIYISLKQKQTVPTRSFISREINLQNPGFYIFPYDCRKH